MRGKTLTFVNQKTSYQVINYRNGSAFNRLYNSSNTLSSFRVSTNAYNSTKESNYNLWFMAGMVGTLSLCTTQVWADEKKPDWKETIKGNYQNRIREWSTPEKVFSTFASVKKTDGDYMTIDDLCKAILPYDYRPEHEHKSIKHIPEFVLLADLDKDQLISFSEYLFFVTLLAIPDQHFKAAFQMFDTDGNGTLNKEEFKQVMKTLRQHSPFAQKQREETEAVDNAGLFTLFFGSDGSKELSFEQFEDFMHKLKRGVLSLEWQRYVGSEKDTMNQRNFGMSLASYAHPKNVSLYLERAEKLSQEDGAITFDQFVNFNKVLEHIEDIALAIKLYAHEGSIDQNIFKRAVKSIAKVDLTNLQVDIMFSIFDHDGDGKLDSDELMAVMQKRAHRSMNHPRDTGFTRLFNCCKQCFKNQENV